MSSAEKTAANLKFLDRVAARNEKIVLSNNISKIKPGSSLEMEVKYLIDKHKYRVAADGNQLLPPPSEVIK